MTELSKLPNIGIALEKRLLEVGIHDAESLKEAGSKEAFTKLYLHEGDTCFNTYCALEGAIQGIRWHYLSDEKKLELKRYFDSIR